MSKRSRRTYEENSNTSFQSIPLISPLESTVLFDVGGGPKNSTGNISSIPVSSSLSSGVQLFQYNGFYWDNSDFNFDFQNNSIGLVLGHFQPSNNIGYFYIVPIFLPHLKCGSAPASLSNNSFQSEDSPTKQLRFYLQQVCYYLNLIFCPTYFGDHGRFVGQDHEAHLFSPLVMAQDITGSVSNNSGPVHTFSPFFDGRPSGTHFPPLLFYVTLTNQIACAYNTNYTAHASELDASALAFGFMSLETFFQDSRYLFNWSGFDVDFLEANAYIGSSETSTLSACMQGNGAGLIGKGIDLLGYYKTKEFTDTAAGTFTSFGDGYTQEERKDFFFNYTRFPTTDLKPNPPVPILNLGQFIAACQKFRLNYTSTTALGGNVIFPFTAQLIASRFISIRSSILTRVQKRCIISNNSSLSSPAVIGVVYPGFLATPPNTFQDATASSSSKRITRGAPIVSSRSLINATASLNAYNSPIISMNPMYSIQTLDLQFLSEYEMIYNNYNQFLFDSDRDITNNPSLNFYQYFQNAGGLAPPAQNTVTFTSGFSPVIPPPAPFNQLPYNPCSDLNSPNQNSVLNNVNLCLAPMYYFVPASCRVQTIIFPSQETNPITLAYAASPTCQPTFNASFLPGTILNHFGRVIGF